MTLTLALSAEAEARLRERAAAAGKDTAEYAARLLEEAVATPSLDEILAPFRRQVDESDMTEEQLQEFFTNVRDRSRSSADSS